MWRQVFLVGLVGAALMNTSCVHIAAPTTASSSPIHLTQVTPADVVASPAVGLPVEWVGRIVDFSHRPEGDKLVLEWICEHRNFVDLNHRSLDQGPIPISSTGEGYFLVNLRTDMAPDALNQLNRKFEEGMYFLYARGQVSSVVTRGERKVVFLYTEKMELGGARVAQEQGTQ